MVRFVSRFFQSELTTDEEIRSDNLEFLCDEMNESFFTFLPICPTSTKESRMEFWHMKDTYKRAKPDKNHRKLFSSRRLAIQLEILIEIFLM